MSGSNALQITDPNADNPLAQAPSWADAAQSVGSGVDALGQWLAAQRAKSAQMGLWNDQTGLPTSKGIVSAAQQTGNALLMGTTAPGIRAFHGSPYDFERFDTSKIGTGEGAQAYGHGLYFAEGENVAQQYRDVLASRSETNTPEGVAKFWANMQGGHDGGIAHLESVLGQIDRYPNSFAPGEADKINQAIQYLKSGGDLKPAGGSMYEVNISADPEQFLHWDKPLSEQSPGVQAAFKRLGYEGGTDAAANPMSGGNIYRSFGDPAAAAATLQQAGVPGIRYLDQGSRGLARLSDADKQQLQAAIADKQRLISDPRQQRDVAMHQADLDLFQRRLNEADRATHNYVVFDDNTIDILRKYGLAGLGVGLSGAAAGTQGQPQQ